MKLGDNEQLTSGTSLKMLGFTFSPEPNINMQVDNLIKKANKRYFLMLRYKRAGLPTSKLKDIYGSVIRSCLEYSVPVYHPQLNQYQTDQLEKVQKRSLRLIYGYDKSYSDLLQLSGLNSLEDRRIVQFRRFANNSLKNKKYQHWFPLNKNIRTGRHTNKYLEETAVGNRLYKSPIYAMRRYLNQSENKIPPEITNLFSIA